MAVDDGFRVATQTVIRLTAERDAAQALARNIEVEYRVAVQDRDAARADADRLAKGGWHYFECPRTRATNVRCTCGWDDALAQHEVEVARYGA